MNKFCKDVIDFLLSEYDNDAYNFNIEITNTLAGRQTTELFIKAGKYYTIKLNSLCMNYLHTLYIVGEFIEEDKQYKWQKELIELIEGS